MAWKNGFIGKGRQKGARRTGMKWAGRRNAPRKEYATIRAEQMGTPAEAFIRRNAHDMEDVWNSNTFKPSGNRLRQEDAAAYGSSRLASTWGAVRDAGTKGKYLSERLHNNDEDIKTARNKLMGFYEVSFGADPKNK